MDKSRCSIEQYYKTKKKTSNEYE